jgi:tRNA(fMet)-specific endonuclease VapC
MICLDTNAVIAAINRRSPHVRLRLEEALVARESVCIPVIALYEMFCGVRKSTRPQANEAALAAFLTLDIGVLPFDSDDAAEAGDIRVSLERAGLPIGPYDILIAAQARRRSAILVTANKGEFSRVPGLKTEDWATLEPGGG